MTDTKLFRNLYQTTEQFMRGRSFVPLTIKELMNRLQLPEQHKNILKKVLKALVKEGIAEFKNSKYTLKKKHSDVAIGVLRVHSRGFGFLQPDDTVLFPQDIFIPKHLTQNAVDGDRVEVLVNQETFSEKGPEGKVLSILERGRTHLAGTIIEVHSNHDIYAYVPMLGESKEVYVERSDEFELVIGDRVIMEVADWGDQDQLTVCRVSHYIGNISDPSVDIAASIEEYNLHSQFSVAALEEAESMGTKVTQKEIQQREDLRELECITIDPDTAKDFDDAISISRDRKKHYHVGVHIADVSHYVKEGTHLDQECKLRCNSTYFPGVCIPMLPPELSNNLCSLKPNVNRLAVTVLMEFNSNGDMLNYRFTRSVIKSKKRLTYKEAKLILDGKKKSPFAKTLRLMKEFCFILKKKRHQRGSLEFAIPELIVLVDEKGKPVKTEFVPYDITHQMIEEFMLKANEVVATHLSEQGKKIAFRVHEVPSPDNMKDFSQLARAFGYKISDNPSQKQLQELFDEALETPYGQYLAICYIRRMKLAMYSSENIGHYGLSLDYYTHFTSPIRRYIDVIVHRSLLDDCKDRDNIDKIASQCSEQERISSKAENSVSLLKKLRLIEKISNNEPYKQYKAIITRVKNFGIYFEVLDFMLEGFLHISNIGDDYYEFNEQKFLLKGKYNKKSFHVGNKITVMLKDINLIYLDTEWHFVK